MDEAKQESSVILLLHPLELRIVLGFVAEKCVFLMRLHLLTDMDDLTTPAPETTTVFNRGMKEVAMLRPNTGAVSPLYELIEAQQLKDLAKGKASYVNKKSF